MATINSPNPSSKSLNIDLIILTYINDLASNA
jgi:hypothetical protein